VKYQVCSDVRTSRGDRQARANYHALSRHLWDVTIGTDDIRFRSRRRHSACRSRCSCMRHNHRRCVHRSSCSHRRTQRTQGLACHRLASGTFKSLAASSGSIVSTWTLSRTGSILQSIYKLVRNWDGRKQVSDSYHLCTVTWAAMPTLGIMTPF